MNQDVYSTVKDIENGEKEPEDVVPAIGERMAEITMEHDVNDECAELVARYEHGRFATMLGNDHIDSVIFDHAPTDEHGLTKLVKALWVALKVHAHSDKYYPDEVGRLSEVVSHSLPADEWDEIAEDTKERVRQMSTV